MTDRTVYFYRDNQGNFVPTLAHDNGNGTYSLTNYTVTSGSGGGLTNIELRAADVKVSLDGEGVTQIAATMPTATVMQNAVVTSGNGTSLNVSGYATAIVNVVANPVMDGVTVVNFEASVDDITWVAILAHQVGAPGVMLTTTSANGDYRINIAGYKSVRARISPYSAGTITIKGYVTPLSAHPTTVTSVDAMPTLDSNLTGHLTITTSGTPVVGSGIYNPEGFVVRVYSPVGAIAYYFEASKTRATAGYPFDANGSMLIRVTNLNQVKFDADTNATVIAFAKI
jgi:hypothetical protein